MTCAQITPSISTEMPNHVVNILRAESRGSKICTRDEDRSGVFISNEEAAVELRGAIMEGFTFADTLPHYVTFEIPFDPS